MTILYFLPLIILDIVLWVCAYLEDKKEQNYFCGELLETMIYFHLIAFFVLDIFLTILGVLKIVSAQTQTSAHVNSNPCNKIMEQARLICK